MTSPARKAKERSDNSAEVVTRLSQVTDRMHALLVQRADQRMGCTENSPEETELAALTDVIEPYDSPALAAFGKVPGGQRRPRVGTQMGSWAGAKGFLKGYNKSRADYDNDSG
jgi:hypothetical protein